MYVKKKPISACILQLPEWFQVLVTEERSQVYEMKEHNITKLDQFSPSISTSTQTCNGIIKLDGCSSRILWSIIAIHSYTQTKLFQLTSCWKQSRSCFLPTITRKTRWRIRLTVAKWWPILTGAKATDFLIILRKPFSPKPDWPSARLFHCTQLYERRKH